jgi:hypothetical protein
MTKLRRASRTRAFAALRRLKDGFAGYIKRSFAANAVDCRTCTTPCCADASFVNVNITRLEAEAMLATLRRSPRVPPQLLAAVRAADAVERYQLERAADTFASTYACPLFEPGRGCLVHYKAKPAPCIQHGCYERWQDLPSETQMRRVERRVAALNRQVYGPDERVWGFATIPAWLCRLALEQQECRPEP